MGNILVALCYMPPGGSQVEIVFSLVPPTSGNVCGLSFSQSQPDLRIFLRLLWFSPLSKIDSKSKNIWLGCCAPGSYMAIKQQPLKCLSHAFGQSCGAASFTLQPLGCKWGWFTDTRFYLYAILSTLTTASIIGCQLLHRWRPHPKTCEILVHVKIKSPLTKISTSSFFCELR